MLNYCIACGNKTLLNDDQLCPACEEQEFGAGTNEDWDKDKEI